MNAGKKKVLFLVTDFYQAGTERFTYEVHNAINKHLFDVDILCSIPLGKSECFSDYYYEKHKALGSNISFLPEVNKIYEPTVIQRIKKKFFGMPFPFERKALREFLDPYDLLAFMGEYNYPIIVRWMTEEQKRKSVIHIMNSKVQTPEIYDKFDKTCNYNFVSGFQDKSLIFELSEIENYNHFYFNLNLSIQNKYLKSDYQLTHKPKVAIFTRLTPNKPLHFFLKAFKELLKCTPQASLHVFGSGNPVNEGLIAILNELQISENVSFHGHQNNILETAINHELDVIWLHGYHGVPGGYAAFELCTTGVPHLFWNCTDTRQDELSSVFPMFSCENELVSASKKLIESPLSAQELGEKQRNKIKEQFDIELFIQDLELYYLNVIEHNF